MRGCSYWPSLKIRQMRGLSRGRRPARATLNRRKHKACVEENETGEKATFRLLSLPSNMPLLLLSCTWMSHGHQGSALLAPGCVLARSEEPGYGATSAVGAWSASPCCSQLHRVCNRWARDRNWVCSALHAASYNSIHVLNYVRVSAQWILLHKVLPVAASCHTTHMQRCDC